MSRSKSAFSITLVVVLVAIVAVLISALLILINPISQVLRADDDKRRTDIKKIYQAIEQYAVDSEDESLSQIPLNTVTGPVSLSSSDGTGLCEVLVPQYLSALPVDPSIGSKPISDCQSTYNTGYQILRDSGGRFTVYADGATPRLIEGDVNVDVPYAYFTMDELLPGFMSSKGVSVVSAAPRGGVINAVDQKYGGAFTFDGATGYFPFIVGTHDLTLAGRSEFTIASWVKLGITEESDLHTIYAERDVDGLFLVHLGIDDHKIVFGGTTNPKKNMSWLTSTITLENDKWYHVEAVFTKTSRELYIDGTRVSQQTIPLQQIAPSGMLNNQIYASIGKSPHVGVSDYFGGVLDDFRVYLYARRGRPFSNEVMNDMNNQ